MVAATPTAVTGLVDGGGHTRVYSLVSALLSPESCGRDLVRLEEAA
ncbi:hypothetical protein [Nonomuraea turkmeniaca]|nr:hypothetical protein [Nonomuraea turkmeniaca]